MNVIQRLLGGWREHRLLPFLWLHGEDENTLREYVGAIYEADCRAFCVESRPHPDFCGDAWWADMDALLDEAASRGMRVWILDDSHFPTGYANGALRGQTDALCRQFLLCRIFDTREPPERLRIDLKAEGLLSPPRTEANIFEALAGHRPARSFDDDQLLKVSAYRALGGATLDLTPRVEGGILAWDKPRGAWRVRVLSLTRNSGAHRDYINMLDSASCRLLIDHVYEPHHARYAPLFGKTIAGFFSDEPELGNGPLYQMDNRLGVEQDLPWSAELEAALRARLGSEWATRLMLLFHDGEPRETAHVRFVYMDAVTRQLGRAFFAPIRDWCHARNVEYIGHVIEDNGQHCLTGCGTGHYFRSVSAMDMAGVDDIGGQVLPQGEDAPTRNAYGRARNGEFYHYGLAKLAQSAAVIDADKRGRALCEIFGNYGWQEGVRLEQYLLDHFLVRGVNHFVPHAFSPKAFPDPDCPPHFYAHGHNPQFRAFCALMRYANRVSTLTSAGRHAIHIAVLYHGDAAWSDNDAQPFEKPLRALYDRQMDCHVIPCDKLPGAARDRSFSINGHPYRALVVPGTRCLTRAGSDAISALLEARVPVLFADKIPEIVTDLSPMPDVIRRQTPVPLAELSSAVAALGIPMPALSPPCDRVRVLGVEAESPLYLLVNEGDKPYRGEISLPHAGVCSLYDPWENRLEHADYTLRDSRTILRITIEPLKSQCVAFGMTCEREARRDGEGKPVMLAPWKRSICESKAYPAFHDEKPVRLPDDLAAEQPTFSGFVRYETTFDAPGDGELRLMISHADEAVEVFVNGESLGVQVAPPFRYDLSRAARTGENALAIEVATTLERACYPLLSPRRKLLAPVPSGGSGLTGEVTLVLYKRYFGEVVS